MDCPPEGGNIMPERSEALKKAQQKYMEKFAVARVRMEKSRYEDIQTAAAAAGESVNAYINTAITQRMERDGHKGPSEAAGAILGDRVVSLPSEADKNAQEAAREALPHIRNDEASKGGQ